MTRLPTALCSEASLTCSVRAPWYSVSRPVRRNYTRCWTTSTIYQRWWKCLCHGERDSVFCFRCRRALIARHFGETWKSSDCQEKCDNCQRKSNISAFHDKLRAYICSSFFFLQQHLLPHSTVIHSLKISSTSFQKPARFSVIPDWNCWMPGWRRSHVCRRRNCRDLSAKWLLCSW